MRRSLFKMAGFFAISANRRGLPILRQPVAVRTLGIPIHGAIGGDVVWFHERTLAVGRGYRTDVEGLQRLEELYHGRAHELIVVPRPHRRGQSIQPT